MQAYTIHLGDAAKADLLGHEAGLLADAVSQTPE
jgi:hypothetical protein